MPFETFLAKFGQPRFERLPQEEQKPESTRTVTAAETLGKQFKPSFVMVLVLVLFAGFTMMGIWIAAHRRRPMDCGKTFIEARAKGCHFEPMQRAWIPDLCYFSEPADEYDPFHDRTWYLDNQFAVQADPSALQAGEVSVAYVANFHQVRRRRHF